MGFFDLAADDFEIMPRVDENPRIGFGQKANLRVFLVELDAGHGHDGFGRRAALIAEPRKKIN